MKRGFTIREYLLGANLFILLIPIGAVVGLRVFDTFLLRQTERRLISESVLTAEAWRDRLLEERGLPLDRVPNITPDADVPYQVYPYEAKINWNYRALPPAPDPVERSAGTVDRAALRAGEKITPLLERAQIFNLSGARVLDAQGCAVATSSGRVPQFGRSEIGYCFADQEEVKEALAGRYHSVVRRRYHDESIFSLPTIRRRSDIRIFTAMPILHAGEVIGVVRMSRTPISPLKMFWLHKTEVGVVLLLCLVLIPALSYYFAWAIAKPVRNITRAADDIASGKPRKPFTSAAPMPRELTILSDALDRMTAQLTSRAEYIEEFASNVSHELKTPISGINGAVELLRDSWDEMSEAQRERFLHNIAADAERMERLVSELLQLARIQNAPEHVEELALAPFIESLCGRFGEAVRVDLTDAPARMAINPEHLETALNNLLANGLRHGGGQGVALRVYGEDGRVAFEVRDEGPGISERNLPRIFDRFFTTERDRGGTGLGLSMVQAVAETRGGSIDVESSEAGTRFTLAI